MTQQDCLFCKIVVREVPARIVYQDETVTAFEDINPRMPVHVLLIPNTHVANTEDLEPRHDSVVGAILRAAREVARRTGVAESGYRLTVNTGRDAHNVVPHLHVHLMGGRKMGWPPG